MNLVQSLKTFIARLTGGASSTGTVVLGTQMAQARAAQQRHEEERGIQPSPLADFSYSSPEIRLWRWRDSPVDHGIEMEIARFAELGEAERNAVRVSLTMNDFYTLLSFAKRSALAALRTGDSSKIEPAFTAMAMIALERIDWRDLPMTSSLVCYAGQRLTAPVPKLVSRAAELAEPQTAEALLHDRTRQIDLAPECGYREVSTPEGAAIFHTSYKHFSPKADLVGIAFGCATALEDNGYNIDRVELATDLPLTWLDSKDGSAIAKMVRKFSGCVSIDGAPRSDPEPMSSGQSLLVFLAEAASEKDAREVATAAQNSTYPRRTQIGLASGQLCAVIIQRSWMADTPPLEDVRSLERLRPVLERLLV